MMRPSEIVDAMQAWRSSPAGEALGVEVKACALLFLMGLAALLFFGGIAEMVLDMRASRRRNEEERNNPNTFRGIG